MQPFEKRGGRIRVFALQPPSVPTVTKRPEGKHKQVRVALKRLKAQVRSLVEHPFRVIKNLLGQRSAIGNWRRTAHACRASLRWPIW